MGIVATCATLGACAPRDAAPADSAAATVPRAFDSVARPAPVTPAGAPIASPDANIVYILDRAHGADSAASAVAATRAASAEVRAFARMLLVDHHELRVQGQRLAGTLGITPVAPADDRSVASIEATMGRLSDSANGAATGAAFDRAYVDAEVTTHEALLRTATAALGAAQSAELKAFLAKVAPTIQGHLDRARSLQAKMASTM